MKYKREKNPTSRWPISQFLKDCQNGTFYPMHAIRIYFGPNDLFEVFKNSS
jgi:hypothetical protein